MGKIFIITGTYDDKPNSEFKAKIVVGKSGQFKGYCEETSKNGRHYQYLCGVFRNAILLLSNDEDRYPILFMINGKPSDSTSSLKAKTGTWKMVQFRMQGNEARIARDVEIQFEESNYDPKLEEEICERYTEVDLQAEWNNSYTVSHYTKLASVIAC